jgi:dethiobiotin synthetase
MTTRVALVGTGTEIGKTHVTCALLVEARARGLSVAAYKPIATGFEARCEDAERHAEALGAPYVAPTFGYRRAVSPHLAAREEARPIDLAQIATRAEALGAGMDVLVVEGAGGLFTPLGETTTNVDLVLALAPDAVILVASDRLGVLHDVGAVRAAALGRGVRVRGVVLSAPAVPDDATGANAAELDALGLGPVLARFPRGGVGEAGTRAAAACVADALGLVSR